MSSSRNYKDISAAALKRREEALSGEAKIAPEKLSNLARDVTSVSKFSGLLSQKEVEITESSAGQILDKIKSKSWSSVEVTEAFIKSAAIAQEVTNCLTEILFAEGRKRAKELDEHLASTGAVVGPLHGLPISLKDCFHVAPHPSSIGMAYHADTPAEEMSEIVKLLLNLGAVPYVKTNVPVAMMMMETDNHVWGKTVNPHHRGLSPGGSSGGEGALIAMYGSPLGVGTDIGGSIRIPSAFCGLYGLRPSVGRFPVFGTRSGMPGQEFVLSVNGPMSRTLEDLSIYSSALLSSDPAASPWTRDPKCVPIPWRSESQIQPKGRKLRLALIGNNDGIVTVHPPVERAMNMTKQALEAAGHEVIPWDLPEHMKMLQLMLEAFLGFGSTAILPLTEAVGEPLFPPMQAYVPNADTKKITGDSLRDMCIRRNAAAKTFMDCVLATAVPQQGKGHIDGIIMPVSPWSAVRNGFTSSTPGNQYIGYTAWVNLLDLAACVFPVTKADSAIDVKRSAFQGLTDIDGAIQADYDPEFYHGSPVSLQLIGERLQEEKVLEVTKLVRNALVASDGIPR